MYPSSFLMAAYAIGEDLNHRRCRVARINVPICWRRSQTLRHIQGITRIDPVSGKEYKPYAHVQEVEFDFCMAIPQVRT